MEEIVVRLDPYTGWNIFVRDQHGNEMQRIFSAFTLEEAMRRFATDTGSKFEMRLTPVRS